MKILYPRKSYYVFNQTKVDILTFSGNKFLSITFLRIWMSEVYWIL